MSAGGFDGNGNYSPPTPQYPAVPGTVIYAEDWNAIIESISSALSAVLVRDGQAPMIGTLNMGGQAMTEIASIAAYGTGLSFSGTISFPATTTGVTADPTDDSTKLATTAFAKHMDSPEFVGNPKAPTPALADNDTSIATTAFVKGQGYAQLDSSPTFTGTVTAAGLNVAGNAAFTGGTVAMTGATSVTAPTKPVGTNTNDVATMAALLAQAFLTALPGISAATAGKFVSNDGVNALWATIPLKSMSRTYAFKNFV